MIKIFLPSFLFVFSIFGYFNLRFYFVFPKLSEKICIIDLAMQFLLRILILAQFALKCKKNRSTKIDKLMVILLFIASKIFCM